MARLTVDRAQLMRENDAFDWQSGRDLNFQVVARLCSAIIRVTDYSLDLEYRYDPWHDSTMLKRLLILVQLAADAVRWCGLVLRSQRSIEAENLFLRRQLALYVERRVERRRKESSGLSVASAWIG